jgi:site-specific DNA-cytosine methylase
MPRVLIACEESGVVTQEFRALGVEAWSCDVEPTRGELPEYHLQQDVIPLLSEPWDMIIAFPPCTHLAVSGARHFAEKRRDGRQQQGVDFFLEFTKVSAPMVAIENPVGIMSTVYRKPDQIVQPYQFGHPETKATCLWLKRLPGLASTKDVSEQMAGLPSKEKHRVHYVSPGPDRAKIRSVTYKGIAKAMAEQWSVML